jgi:hypothetical protein
MSHFSKYNRGGGKKMNYVLTSHQVRQMYQDEYERNMIKLYESQKSGDRGSAYYYDKQVRKYEELLNRGSERNGRVDQTIPQNYRESNIQ